MRIRYVASETFEIGALLTANSTCLTKSMLGRFASTSMDRQGMSRTSCSVLRCQP